MSGSMSGTHADESAILATAINNIACTNANVTGSLIYCETEGSFRIPMPFEGENSETLLKMTNANGSGEHIREAVDANMKEFKKADITLCFTDGSLSGKDVEPHKLAGMGVNLIGLYTHSGAGSPEIALEYHKRNKRWFNQLYLDVSVEALAQKIATLFTIGRT